MSSFTEYHKKWKEDNGKTEDSAYRQRSISEIQESTEQYVNSMFGKEGKIWDKIKSKANDNLSRSNNMQNLLDRNTRNQMVKPLEDYTNAKRESMQSVSNAIQENTKRQREVEEDNKKVITEMNNQFRKQYPSTVNTNQKQNYEQPKTNIKLAKDEDINNKNLKRIDTTQFYTTKQDAKDGNVLGYVRDKVATGFQSVGDSILNLYTTDMMKNNQRAKSLNNILKQHENDGDIDSLNENLKELTNNTDYQAKKTAISLAEQDFSKGIQTLGNASESVGAMIPSIVAGAINPTAGLAVTGVTASGSAMKQALDEGATPEQAQRAGVLKGAVEVATEKLFGGVKFFGKGTMDEIFTDKVLDKVSSRIGRFTVQQGYDITGEVIEENISNLAGYGIDKLVLDKDLPTLKEMIEDADETTKTTILSTLMLKALGMPINVNVTDDTNLTKEQRKVVEKVENMMKDKEILQPSTNNLQQNDTNTPINPLTQQITNQENKTAQNGNMEQIDNNIANNQEIMYNDNGLDKVRNVPIEDVLQFKTDGGYRNEQYITKLREDIKAKGIKYPIELVRNSDGSIEIENGNHRLQVASELGLKQVPIKFVESWDNIGNVDSSENKIIERLEVYDDRNNANSREINSFNGGSKINKEYSSNYRNKFENREATTRDDRLYNRVQAFDNRPSSNSTFKQDFKKRQELEESNSFNLQNNNSNSQQNDTNNPINPLTQQITNQESKTAQIENMKLINNIQQSTDYNNSNYFETAKKYNLSTENKSIKGIYEVASKRGINVFYDDTVFTNTSQNAKWTVDNSGNRSVVLNPNANTDMALQSVMIHELTHDLEGTKEYNKISTMVLDRLKSSGNYDNMMLDIAKAYENEYNNISKEQFRGMIEQEAVADFLGENLGNQEFVNDLVRSTDKSQIQKIVDWIKNKITSLKNTVTGNKELNYWNKIKENFERAYNKEYQGNSLSERFSIQTDSNGNQYVKVDTDQNIFEGKSISEQTKIAKKYILENFREKGLNYEEGNAKVTSKTANEYTHPKNQLPYKTKQSKMKASTELDNILNVSKYEYSANDDGRHSFAKDGWDYYKTTFEVDGVLFEGLINIAKSGNNKTFYDITNIKRISQNRSASDNSFSTSLTNSNNSILPTKENVNSDTSNNYTQESEKNSGSFNLPVSDKFSKQANGVWQQYLRDTSINTGIRENLKDIKRVPISKENLQRSNLANNQQTLYNNTESEGGISEREINEYEGSIIDRRNRVYEEKENSQNREYNWKEYSKWEQSIRPKEEIRQSNRDVFEQFINETNTKSQKTNNAREEFEKRFREATRKRISEEDISENSKNNKKILKDVYDTDIFFIEDNVEFSGGADEKLNLIYLTKEIANSKDNNVATGHELFEVIRNTREDIKNEYIEPLIDIVKNDNNFNEVLKKYVDNCETKDKQLLLDNPRYIAKEILFDEAGFMFNEDDFNLGVQKQETNLIRFSDYLDTSKAVLQMGLSNIEQKARKNNKIITNENMQEQTNTTNQLKEVEDNTQSLGYKVDIEGKQRKHYKSVMESDQVGEVGKQSAKSLLENDTYQPLSNIDTLATANENIQRNGADNTYIAFRNKINSNERITLQDIATGERLIQIFSQGGDFDKVNGLVQDVAMLGTELGQQVQAMSLIKRMSPEGQLMFLNKMVDRLNLKENADLKVSEDMSKRILETKNETELENVMTDIAIELGEQLPVNMGDKVRAWRYLSMLGNPKTHIKNLGANVAMNVTQQMKNKVAGAMEDVVGIFNKDIERTKTLRPANSDQRSFAKQDAEFMKDKIDGGGKYDIKNMIQSNKKQFDNKVLNAIANFNSDMLELEDNIFLKKAYQQAMQNYMSANKLSSSDMENSSVLQQAREYASLQAQEATFHQFSELAQKLTEIENKGGFAGKFIEAVIPFKKTPINVAKSGIEYSPIGLAKSFTYDIVQLNKKTKDYRAKLEKGIISETDYKMGTSRLVTKTIDNIAKGFSGTSLTLLGYALADMGILKAGNDDEEDEFKEKLGEQEYAIRIGNNTYTLDWLSPSAIPMFIGATSYDLIHSEKEDYSDILNSFMTSSAKSLEPMTELSMLQGLTSAISSYEQGSSNMLFDLGASAVSSYFGQFVPTALGQVAKTIDDKERDTSSTEKGFAKKVDQFKKQQLAKIPIASKLLPARKDVWGNEKTRDSNILVRAYEVGLAPYNRKKVVEDYTEKELLKVFEDTGEKSILPGVPNKDITINKQKYRLTAEEYNKAKESFGKTSKGMLDSLIQSKEYKNLNDEQKAEAINNIYSYAKEKIKVDYAKDKKQEIETTSLYNILSELKNLDNQSEYLSYASKIKEVEKEKEKKQILSDSNYSLTTKEIIYKNTFGKEDELYNSVLAKDKVNINEYLNYKLQNFESDKEDDGTTSGKAVSGSKKKKVYEYVNNMNITRQQKLAILGTQYKLNRNEQRELYEYINNMPGQTQKEKSNIFSKYSSNFTIYKNNTISYK